MSEFKDVTVKMGECEILLSYDSKTNKIDILSKDIGDIVFGDNDNIDSFNSGEERLNWDLKADDEGNIRHGVKGNLPSWGGKVMK